MAEYSLGAVRNNVLIHFRLFQEMEIYGRFVKDSGMRVD